MLGVRPSIGKSYIWEVEELAAPMEAGELRAIADGAMKRGKYLKPTAWYRVESRQ